MNHKKYVKSIFEIIMFGAITVDIIGSVYAFDSNKPEYNFPLFNNESKFTDDDVLNFSLTACILSGVDYKTKMLEYYFLYRDCSYGNRFPVWANNKNPQPYNSWENGSAMRVSPMGWAYYDLEMVLQKVKESAEVTHSHPKEIKEFISGESLFYLGKNYKLYIYR